MAAGYGIGYGMDVLMKTHSWRIAGLFLGLAGGLWTAARVLKQLAWNGKRGEPHT